MSTAAVARRLYRERCAAVALKSVPACQTRLLLSPEGRREIAPTDASPSTVLLVPDGTWSQTRRMAIRDPVLLHATHVRLPAGPESVYLLRKPPLPGHLCTLEAVARYPIVTYEFAFANRSLVEKAFAQRGLAPKVVLTALDADVIKAYVELGLGVGIMAAMAFHTKRDAGLKALDASHLFESSTTRLGIKRGAYLRRYAYEFIESFAPHLPRALVEPAVTGAAGSRYEL